MITEIKNGFPRFRKAIVLIDEANEKDPRKENTPEGDFAYEFIYSAWVSRWIYKLSPKPSDELLLAARAAHICRWTIPREDFPMDRKGYHAWRRALANFHADKAGKILKASGYDDAAQQRVKDIILKKNLPRDPEVQILEDALALVFIEHQLSDFIKKTEYDKLVGILRKTWDKMSAQGRAHAQTLELSPELQRIIAQAIKQ